MFQTIIVHKIISPTRNKFMYVVESVDDIVECEFLLFRKISCFSYVRKVTL